MTNQDWLDDMLKAPHVDDDGFAERVSQVVARRDEARPGRSVLALFGMLSLVFLVAGGMERADQLAQLMTLGVGSKVVVAVAAGLAALAAWFSGEGLRLDGRKLLTAGGPAPMLLRSHDDVDGSSSAAAVPTINAAFKKPVVLIERNEDLDEETALEVVRAARKHRVLFGTVWFFFLAAPFIMIALDSRDLGVLVDVLTAMIVCGFLVGTPVVWLTSRQAFFKECEQLGITRKFARRLRFRLSIANVLYAPVDERDPRAVARIRGLKAPKTTTTTTTRRL
ncbi:MAG: hypothetical protein Q8O67_01235 [Deltaproteobacteria bacterium]|nr:hypothetical protein [Deltaproteobacteria bacterium]